MTGLRPLPSWKAKEWDDLIDRAKELHTRDCGEYEIPPVLRNKALRVGQVLVSFGESDD